MSRVIVDNTISYTELAATFILDMGYLVDTFCKVDKVLPDSSKNPYKYMVSDVFGTLFILKFLL